MRRLHLIAGLIVFLIFIGTGQIMAHHEPHMSALSPEVRLLFRSRHIYLLAGALLAAPVLLLIAFLTEPERGLHGKMRFGRGGIVALAPGTLAHLLSGAGRKDPAR
jgi:hypothetical protein